MCFRCLLTGSCLASLILVPPALRGAEPRTFDLPASGISLQVRDNGIKTLTWPRLPSLESNQLLTGNAPDRLALVPRTSFNGDSAAFTYLTTNDFTSQFFAVHQTTMSSNALLTAIVLNRLAYGPTPDDLARILTGPSPIGPQAYIDEQLNFETLPQEPMDTIRSVTTNATPLAPPTNWLRVTAEGVYSSERLYLYLAEPGDAYVDNIALHAGTGENVDRSTNFVRNGDFESDLSGPWTVSTNHAASTLDYGIVCSGSASLHLVASSGGLSRPSYIWQDVLPGLAPAQPCTLSFDYLPATNSSILNVRLAAYGVGASPTNAVRPNPTWVHVTRTGIVTGDRVFIYLDRAGALLVDDLSLVRGAEPETGINLLPNGGFESLKLDPWTNAPVAAGSFVNTSVSHSGNASLNLVFSGPGERESSAVVLPYIPGLRNGETCTLSYWYTPGPAKLIIRLRGAGTGPTGIRSQPDDSLPLAYHRLTTSTEGATLADLRAWYLQHAVGARRQLLEVLTQFWENHFVTQHEKSRDFFDRYYDDYSLMDRLAANLEFREIHRWRLALARPNVAFHDLLLVHAQSPAQIIYLDTVDSRGDRLGAGPDHYVANENYARELLELFCNGVNNGYDQSDIVALSRVWTGWRIDVVDPGQIDNPFAPRSTTFRVPSGTSATSNLLGTWSFVYQSRFHDGRAKTLFQGKTVDDRFGPPWAGRDYQLDLPQRDGPDGIQDGYDVLRHLANLPYTQEFISVKLCRLFVHDDFQHGSYDYRDDAHLTPEARLVKQCMLAWESANPKGQLRPLLNTIFSSQLFQSHHAAAQKIKTPLEFAVSVVRALRAQLPDGTYTSTTDGYSIGGTQRTSASAPLNRMGGMLLFDRSDPDGYPESGPPWISAGTLAERLRFVQAALLREYAAGKTDGIAGGNHTLTDPVALLKFQLPDSQWNDSGAVTDYFLGLLYPSEGRANLEDCHATANTFLNTDDNGLYSPLSALSPDSSTYDLRVRGAVSMLMTLQRFQEQ